jgi:hypothetical protein
VESALAGQRRRSTPGEGGWSLVHQKTPLLTLISASAARRSTNQQKHYRTKIQINQCIDQFVAVNSAADRR